MQFQRAMFNEQIEHIIKIIQYNTSTITKLTKSTLKVQQRTTSHNVFPRSQTTQYKALSSKVKTIQIERLIYITAAYGFTIAYCGDEQSKSIRHKKKQHFVTQLANLEKHS